MPLLHRRDQLGGHHQVAAVADHGEDVAVSGRRAGCRATPAPRSPCRSSRTRRGSALRSRTRHSLCRSPGIEPAAHSTTSRGSVSSLTQPSTSPCVSRPVGEPVGDLGRRVVRASTAASHCRPQRGLARPVRRRRPATRRARRSARSAPRGRRRRPTGRRACPRRSAATLMLTNRTSASWKAVREAVVKSLVPGADADDHVGLGGQGVGRRGAGRADGAHSLRVPVRQRALAGLALADRDAGRPRRTPRSASSAPE